MREHEDKIIRLKEIFEKRGLTLACAESCTGGLLSASIAALPGVSSFFLGSVVSYHWRIKNKILKVPISAIQVVGEVSTLVALAMARGVRSELGSDWAVAITGVAGPTGGTLEKPVGTVCFAVVGPGGMERTVTRQFGSLSRAEIQGNSVDFALEMLLEMQ